MVKFIIPVLVEVPQGIHQAGFARWSHIPRHARPSCRGLQAHSTFDCTLCPSSRPRSTMPWWSAFC